MGLDIGEVRTGVAVTDPLRIVATPLVTLAMVGKPQPDAQTIARVVAEIGPTVIVAGTPLNQHGEPGPQARKVDAVLAELRKLTTIPVVTVDERFSSAEAQRHLRAGNVKAKKQRGAVDQLAAVILLESYLRREQNRGA